MVKETKKKDTHEDRIRRIKSALASMDIGETAYPTPFFKNLGIHPQTGEDYLDIYDGFNEINFQIIRDKSSAKIRQIVKVEKEDLDLRKDINKIGKDLIDIKEKLNRLTLNLKMNLKKNAKE